MRVYSKLKISVFVILSFLLLSACSMGESERAWQKINDENALLVDVRTMEEYDAGHLPGAKLIPHDQIEGRLSEFGIDKGAPIVVYCKWGVRAKLAKETLAKHGFTNVINGGGYIDMLETTP